MKIGLIGLPKTGKTTVFNLLTGRAEETSAYSAKAETHLARIDVPDPRVDLLSKIFEPKKTTYGEIEFADLVGVGVGGGSGIGSAALEELRNLDALVHVIRLFEDEGVPQDRTSTGPAGDLEAMEQELILTDLILVEKRLEKLEKDIGKGRKDLVPERDVMLKLQENLEAEKPIRDVEFRADEETLLRTYQLISRVPMIILFNGDGGDQLPEGLDVLCESKGLGRIAMNGLTEWEITQLDAEERAEFLADLGVSEPARDRFIRLGYELLDLISFFTVGADEVRAWTISRDLPAVRAAGKIHSDLERGFIRAETIAYETFKEMGTLAEARKQGALRLEGKDYPVQDGDILNIRFNV